MTSPESSARRRVDAYFSASFEVARRLSEGRGSEAVAVLRRELNRTRDVEDVASRRFLLSQIALCQSRMGEAAEAQATLEEIEDTLPQDIETALMLAEGYLLLVANAGRASHHAARALQWLEEEGEVPPDTLSRAHSLMARALLHTNDVLGAFGAWKLSPLPDWRVAVELIEAGHDPQRVLEILRAALPQHRAFEATGGSDSKASADRIERLIVWIEAGCPKNSQLPV